jgi:hypothetical protein
MVKLFLQEYHICRNVLALFGRAVDVLVGFHKLCYCSAIA